PLSSRISRGRQPAWRVSARDCPLARPPQDSLASIRPGVRGLKQLVGRDGIEPPTPGFSVLVCRVLPRGSGYEGKNYELLSEIPLSPPIPPRTLNNTASDTAGRATRLFFSLSRPADRWY